MKFKRHPFRSGQTRALAKSYNSLFSINQTLRGLGDQIVKPKISNNTIQKIIRYFGVDLITKQSVKTSYKQIILKVIVLLFIFITMCL